MNERPELEKGSRKYICPSCQKKTFVYYRMPNGELINELVGRCDREDNCGYHYTPKEWFTDHPTDRDSNPQIKRDQNYRPIKAVTIEPMGTIPMRYILDSAKTRNSNFVYFLFYLFDWETIKRTIDPYFIGCTKDKAVIFPQIDEQGKCRTAKIQKYDPETGKRVKDEPGAVNWVHAILKKKGELSENYNLQMCLFGLHLIRSENNKGKTICICESEKSAIIAAGAMPEFLWMASGALGWLNIDKLKPLKGWNILLFPDTSKTGVAFDKWTQIAKEAQSIGINVSISTLLEDNCTDEEKERGYDIGDYLIDRLRVPTRGTPKKQLTEAEKQLIEMQHQNPVLTELINVFELQLIK